MMVGPVSVFADVGQICVEDGRLPEATVELARRVGPDQVIGATACTIETLEPPADPFSPDADRLLEAASRAEIALSDMVTLLRRRRRIARWARIRDRQQQRGRG